MAEPLGRSATTDLLASHGIRLSKRLGQHFLSEPNTVRRIVEIAGAGPGDLVVEVGAGAGTLTRALAATGASVIAYEIDESLRPVLDETLAGIGGVEMRFADAMKVDFEADLPAGEWAMVANLPYNVGTPLVLQTLQRAPRVSRLVVMLQREAIDRFVATPGSRVYGLPSVIVALHATASVVLQVPSHVFTPPTPVSSSVVAMSRIESHPLAPEAIRLAAAAFGQRRKMLRSSLRTAVDDPTVLLDAAGIDPTRRAEELAPDDFLRLAAVA